MHLDNLVSEEHLVRKLENAIDLSFIHELTKDLYSPFGKESIDPIVLIKLNIVQYLFGIRSMRQTIKNIIVDAGYKIPAIAKMIIGDGRTPIMPYKRHMTKKGFFKKHEYVYDEYYDCDICSNNEVLKYYTNREGYKEYKSNPIKCKDCPYLQQCTESKNHVKLVARHVWEQYIEQAEDIRHTTVSKELYSLRSQTIERVFADAKELHSMRYTRHRGLDRMKMELNLLFAYMNLKKLASKLWKNGLTPFAFLLV